jgi:hypothetical protein
MRVRRRDPATVTVAHLFGVELDCQINIGGQTGSGPERIIDSTRRYSLVRPRLRPESVVASVDQPIVFSRRKANDEILAAMHRTSILGHLGLSGHRHRARWAVSGVEKSLPLFEGHATPEAIIPIPMPTAGEDMRADYATVGMTLAGIRYRSFAANWPQDGSTLKGAG